MAETTVLRGAGIVRNASPNATTSQPSAQLSGQHKTVNVTMGSGGKPQVQGQNQGQQMVRQGVVLLPPKAGARQFRTGESAPGQPAKSTVTVFERPGAGAQALPGTPEAPPLSADQLMLCRHLVDKYVTEQKAIEVPDGTSAQNTKIAEDALKIIDAQIAVATAAAAAIAAEAAAVAASAAMAAAAPPPPPKAVSVGTRQIQANAGPRRVARPNRPAPPPVVVNMTDGEPQVVDPSEAAGATDATAPTG